MPIAEPERNAFYSMNLITLQFSVAEEDQREFVQMLEEINKFWKDQGFTVSLFRDTTDRNKFQQIFLSEKNVEDLVDIIQTKPEAKKVFDWIKNSGSRVVISVMEQLL